MSNRVIRPARMCTLAAALLAAATAARAAEADAVRALLEKIRSEDPGVRYAAWRSAHEVGAPAVIPLGELLVSGDRNIAKAARSALEGIVHHTARPGAEEERAAVCAGLLALAGADRPAEVRREALHLLSFIGGEREVPVAARAIRDANPRVREDARLCLERIPGAAATKALLDALPDAPAAFRPAIIHSLGARGAAEAVPALLKALADPDRPTALAAADALSRIGEYPESQHAQSFRFEDLTETQKRTLIVAGVRLTRALARKGETTRVLFLYRALQRQFPDDPIQCAVIDGLAAIGSRHAIEGILPALTHASAAVRATARSALLGLRSPEADAILEDLYAHAAGPTKAALLRVLAERETAGVEGLVREAARAEDPELRVTAFHISGGLDDPALLPVVREAAGKGSPQIREIAMGSFLEIARTRLAKGARDEARGMLEWALGVAPTSELKRRALAGLAAVADPRSIEKIRPLMEASDLRTDAARAYIACVAALGKAGERERAIRMLADVVGAAGSTELKDFALAKLRDLGADTTVFAKRAGFITTWHLVGPFPSPNKSAFARAFFPEKAIDLEEGGVFEGKRYRWKKVTTDAVPAKIDLTRQFTPHDNVAAYAYAVILSDRERKVKFRIGSDDGCVLWLNGEKLHATNADRGFSLDQDVVVGTLRMGENRILLKILQGVVDWAFCVRITNPGNKPLDLTRFEIRG